MEKISFNREATKSSIGFLLIGWICALTSLFIYPFIFGVLGVVCGILATKRESRGGLPLIVSSIILMGIGLMFNRALLVHLSRFLGF